MQDFQNDSLLKKSIELFKTNLIDTLFLVLHYHSNVENAIPSTTNTNAQ